MSAENALDGFQHAGGLERLDDEVLGPRLSAGLRLAHDLETGLREDVADHRPHENRVIADENRMAHRPSLGSQYGGQQSLSIEHHEHLPTAPADSPHQLGIEPRQRLA